MSSGLASYQQQGHIEMGRQFKVSSERPEKQGVEGSVEIVHAMHLMALSVSLTSLIGRGEPICTTRYLQNMN